MTRYRETSISGHILISAGVTSQRYRDIMYITTIYIYFLNKISVKIIVIIISEQSLDGWESWENIPVKFSNVNYPQTKDNNAPQNFFVAIFCCVCGFGKTYLLTKL